MGKLLIIIILVVAVIVTVISLGLNKDKQDQPEETSYNMSKIQAGSLSKEALNYGINKIKEGAIDFTNNEALLNFNNFNVLDGTIDSIRFYKYSLSDTILINTFVSYQVNNKIVHKKSSALISYCPSKISNAVEANGDIVIRGHASVDGDIKENSSPPLDFEVIFGASKAYAQSIATYYYSNPANNPMPVSNITWVNLTSGSSFHATNSSWSGSGLLIIDGDATFSGGTFSGVIWVTGALMINGNIDIAGAIYAEGGTDIDDTVITGTPEIIFDPAAVEDAIGVSTLPAESTFEILSWFDESD